MVLDTDIAFRFTHLTVSLVLPRKVTGPKLGATYQISCESTRGVGGRNYSHIKILGSVI